MRRSQGMSLEEAVVDVGAVRFRPMLLTAAAVVVGGSVILFDPIFQDKQSPSLHPHSPENIADCEVAQCELTQ